MRQADRFQVADCSKRMEARTSSFFGRIAEYHDAASGKGRGRGWSGRGDEADTAFAIASEHVDRAQQGVTSTSCATSSRAERIRPAITACAWIAASISIPAPAAGPTAKRCQDCQRIRSNATRPDVNVARRFASPDRPVKPRSRSRRGCRPGRGCRTTPACRFAPVRSRGLPRSWMRRCPNLGHVLQRHMVMKHRSAEPGRRPGRRHELGAGAVQIDL